MAEAELRKLKRTELLEMLIEQSKEVEKLQGRISELEQQLSDKEIRLEKAGTIAEAAFQMNGVLEAAQAAAQQYLDNIRQLNERQETICAQKTEETEAYVAKLLKDTQVSCDEKERNTADKCAAMEMTVQERCDLMKEETRARCDEMSERVKEECARLEEGTRLKCVKLEQETEAKSIARIKEAEDRYNELTQKAEQDVEARWEILSRRLEDFYRAHEGLRELLTSNGGIQREAQ
ncbi:MAG: hypothetical protein SOW08_14300 [Lachnospiraceae bacterium]|nr:hypothetical protein [Lachnospiraceae bacterium]